MSHFCVIVLCPSDRQDDREALVSRAEKALSPFSEELEVEPYLVECFCVGARARRHASELADTNVGPLDQYWNKTESEREATPWETYISPWLQAYEQAESEHPLYRSPDPECPECLGTGERESL